MESGKILVYIVLGLIAAYVALHVLHMLFGLVVALIWHVVIPIAIIGGIGYLIYNALRPKSLGGGGRSLP